jgi:hypothetical protein
VFEPPTSDDYYTGDTPSLEFQLDDLLGGTTDEIGGTQLTGAPLVTRPTQQMQEHRRVMMEDFHDSAQRASEALVAATSVEAEARATGGGPVPSGSVTPEPAIGGGRPVGLGDSIGSNRRGAPCRPRRLHRQRPEGGRPVGLRCSLSDTAPLSRASGRRTRSPSM